MLAVAVAAVLAGARSLAAIGEWTSDAPDQVQAALGVHRDPWTGTRRGHRAPRIFDAISGLLASRCPGLQPSTQTLMVDGTHTRGLVAKTSPADPASINSLAWAWRTA